MEAQNEYLCRGKNELKLMISRGAWECSAEVNNLVSKFSGLYTGNWHRHLEKEKRAEEVTQLVKWLLQGKHEDLKVLSTNARERAGPVPCRPERRRQAENPESTLASQPVIQGMFQVRERPCLKQKWGGGEVLCLTSDTQNCTLATIRHRYLSVNTWTKEKLKKTGKLPST